MTTAVLTKPEPGAKRRPRDPDAPNPAEAVANRIIELLDQGQMPPWQQGWNVNSSGYPQNAVSKKPYRGINFWMTLITQMAAGYKDPRWLTFRQAKVLGGHVRKGEKSTHIVFWKILQRDPDTELQPGEIQTFTQGEAGAAPKAKSFPMARLYNVFNVEQVEGCEFPALDQALVISDPIEAAEAIIAAMPNPPGFDTYEARNQAPHYIPSKDVVRVPDRGRYNKPELYYNSVFHELTHATGHSSRLARPGIINETGKASHDYGVEELVAGMGAAMLGDRAGIGHETLEFDAAYVKHWRDVIAADKSIVLKAAQQAQKAVDYICPPEAPENDQPEADAPGNDETPQ